MVDLYWPAEIDDRPLREPLPWQPMANIESFSVEEGDGLEITAPRMSKAPLRMSPTYPMTPDQFQRFLGWWQDDCKGGAVAFWLPEPYSREPRRWRLQVGQQIGVAKPHPQEFRVTLPLVEVL